MTTARGVLRTLRAFGLASAIGCSLVVDPSDIDAQCGPGRKLCPDQLCVAIDDPAYGCSATLCAPCRQVPNAMPACDGEECVFHACAVGFGCVDCSENILTSEEHCGECNRRCGMGETCQDGACVTFAR